MYNVTNIEFSDMKKYRKISTVDAIKMHSGFDVKTPYGVMTGEPGDYLCEDTEEERRPMKKEIFEKTYREV